MRSCQIRPCFPLRWCQKCLSAMNPLIVWKQTRFPFQVSMTRGLSSKVRTTFSPSIRLSPVPWCRTIMTIRSQASYLTITLSRALPSRVSSRGTEPTLTTWPPPSSLPELTLKWSSISMIPTTFTTLFAFKILPSSANPTSSKKSPPRETLWCHSRRESQQGLLLAPLSKAL